MPTNLIKSTSVKLAPAKRAPTYGNLAFAMQPQQQSQWCWAAVATSVALFYRPGIGKTQCTLVNQEFGQTTCCRTGGSAVCNKPWLLERALQRNGNLQSWTGGYTLYGVIQAQITSKRPLGVRIAWSGGGGHVVIIDGYNTSSPSAQFITVRDPAYGSSIWAYARFLTAYQGTGTWSHTFYTKP